MKRQVYILFVCFLASCNNILPDKKSTKTNKLENLQEVDYNEIDAFPLFESCDESVSKTLQKECFENTLIDHFTATINEFEFKLPNDIIPTIYVDFVINNEGQILVLHIDKDPVIEEQMPEFDGIIIQSLKSLPTLAPALKRGIPVKAKFRIPIELKTNNE